MLKRIKEKKKKKGTSCSTGCFHCMECTLGSICVATVATKFKVVSITKIQRRCIFATVAEIGSFLSRRRLSPLSLSSVFPYTATVTKTQFSTTAAIVGTFSTEIRELKHARF